jgi:hypothetical protein
VEQARVVGHLNHHHKPEAPRVSFSIIFPPENACAPVNSEVDIGIVWTIAGLWHFHVSRLF